MLISNTNILYAVDPKYGLIYCLNSNIILFYNVQILLESFLYVKSLKSYSMNRKSHCF